MLMQPEHRHMPARRPITISGHTWVSSVTEYAHSRQATWALAQQLMGIDWMTRPELVESIPPAYTEHVGAELMRALALDPAA